MYLARSVRISDMRTVCWDETSYDRGFRGLGVLEAPAVGPFSTGATPGPKPRGRGGFPTFAAALVEIPQPRHGALFAEIAVKQAISPAGDTHSGVQVHAIPRERDLSAEASIFRRLGRAPGAIRPDGRKGFPLA